MSRLPSLSALRAFEAAARRLSFKDAASELSVTPGAISQQIRGLEEELGVSLFDRAPRSVTLTAAGRSLMPEVTEGFMMIRDAVDRIRPSQAPRLTICTAGMIMRNWLFPRLHGFTAHHPDLQTNVRVANSWDEYVLQADEVCIRLMAQPPHDLFARPMHRLLLIPVASPAFLAQNQVRGPEDAKRLPLLDDGVIHLFQGAPGWELWWKAAGLKGRVPPYAMSFDQQSADYAFDMALAGDGLLLGWSIQCFQALSEGRLQYAFGPIVELEACYYLTCRKRDAKRPHIKAFMDWATQEAALLSTLRSLQPGAA
ncbi:MAG: LysR family transcriptional regulator [Pseudomonadota bacterium]